MESLIKLDYLFYFAGIILLIAALLILRDKTNPKRITSGLFWGFYGIIFLFGEWIPALWIGIFVVAMGVIAGLNGVGSGKVNFPPLETLQQRANQLKNKLFIPTIIIPLITLICAMLLKDTQINGIRLFPAKSETLAGLGVACVLSLILACFITRETPMQSMRETRRLFEAMSWAMLLPQLLAVLGIIFTDAGVGKSISYITSEYMAVNNRFVAVAAYCIGMALFTMIMGNAFAAFPVITAGIGLPILVLQHGANPAVICAIGMFSGYCGTLMTPMAANYNIVPAALLELKDKNAVIKAQIGTALPLLVVNILLMYFFAFL